MTAAWKYYKAGDTVTRASRPRPHSTWCGRCYAAAMARKPRIAIVGPGRLGSALAVELTRAGYRISDIVSGKSSESRRKGRALAKLAHSRVVVAGDGVGGERCLLCVCDRRNLRVG